MKDGDFALALFAAILATIAFIATVGIDLFYWITG